MKTRKLTYAALAFLICLSPLLIAQQQPPAQAQAEPADPAMKLVRQAQQANNQGKQDEALALFLKAIETSPKLYQAHLGAGIVLDLQGKYEEARKHLAHAIELAPPQNQDRALRTMGMSYAFERNARGAEKYHGQAFEARMAKQDYEGAAGVANELARVLLESEDIAAAEKWYRTGYQTALKKADLTPAQKALWEFRWEHAQARLAARRGQHEQAKKHAAAAKTALDQANEPEQAQYYPYLLGYLAFYAGDYQAAIAELEKANQRDPFIQALLAQAHEKLGNQDRAMEHYRKVLEANFHNPTVAYARPLAMQKLGKQAGGGQ